MIQKFGRKFNLTSKILLCQQINYGFQKDKYKTHLDNVKFGPGAGKDQDLVNFSYHIQDKMKELYDEPVNGKLAQYIPELRNENPYAMACSICTVDGKQVSIGMDKHKFTMSACIKPFNYLQACQEYTRNKIHEHVGREPSGKAYNSFQLNYDNLPYNPMVNSGAITVAGMIQNQLQEQDRFNFIYDRYKSIIRRNEEQEQEYQNNCIKEDSSYMELRYSFCYQTYMSEKKNGSRNTAIAHFINGEGVNGPALSSEQVLKNLKFYYESSCLKLNTNSAAAMAATIASGGISPINNQKYFEQRHTVSISQIMFSCGMYNYSGNWACNVGIPAKSGVCGLVIAAIPNQMGIAFYSPPLDTLGNSEKGVKFFEWLAEEFHFNVFQAILSDNKPYQYWRERSKQPRGKNQSNEIIHYSKQKTVQSYENNEQGIQQGIIVPELQKGFA